jgi:hypothetical protein
MGAPRRPRGAGRSALGCRSPWGGGREHLAELLLAQPERQHEVDGVGPVVLDGRRGNPECEEQLDHVAQAQGLAARALRDAPDAP